MRRLVLESTTEELGRLMGAESSLRKIELFEVVSFLREEPDEVAMICRVKFKGGATKLEDVLLDDSTVAQHLEEEKGGAHIYFLRRKYGSEGPTPKMFVTGGYLTLPFEIRDGRIRATFLGNVNEVKRFRKIVDETGMRYKVISLGDARFSLTSPLANLTEKQRKVLIAAFNLGYYDLPKRISSNELGRRLGMRSSTLVVHRIKAERRILAQVLKESPA
jgi:predicted DNA binding protein